MLIGNTLGFWLADDNIKLATIGALSWVGLSYVFKFVWGAMVDRIPLPLIGRLGRRRSWMLLSQIVAGGGLIGMGLMDPKTQLGWLVVCAIVAAVGAATQDTAMDAWRIETAADADELGLLTAAYSLGYRFAPDPDRGGDPDGRQAARLADQLCDLRRRHGSRDHRRAAAKEPAAADAVMAEKAQDATRHPAMAVYDAVIGPLITFFRTHGWAMAALMLSTITFYHLCDYMRGPMSNPYYKALAIDKDTIGWTRLFIGTPWGFLGIAAGGFCSLRLGNVRTLILGAILQPIGIGAFALLGWHGGDYALFGVGPVSVSAFQAIMAFDSVAIGLLRRRPGGLHVDPHQPGLHRHPVRPADLGAGLDRQVPQGLLRRDRGTTAARPQPAGRLRPVLPAGRGAGPTGDPALHRAGAGASRSGSVQRNSAHRQTPPPSPSLRAALPPPFRSAARWRSNSSVSSLLPREAGEVADREAG